MKRKYWCAGLSLAVLCAMAPAVASLTPPGTAELQLPSVGAVAEQAVAVDPRNPRHVVVAAIGFGYYRHSDAVLHGYQPDNRVWTSDDGGRSFVARGGLPFALPRSRSSGNDATLAWDPRGPLYAAYLNNEKDSPGNGAVDGLWVARSDDAGKTWTGVRAAPNTYTATACQGPDRPTVAVDPRSGAVWVVYQHVVYAQSACLSLQSTEIRAVRSLDRGKTWSRPFRVSAVGGNAGVPAVLEDGTLAVVHLEGAGVGLPEQHCALAVSVNLRLVSPSLRVSAPRTLLPHVCAQIVAGNNPAGEAYYAPYTPTATYDTRSKRLVVAIADAQVTGGVARVVSTADRGATQVTTTVTGTPSGAPQLLQLAAGAGRVALSFLDGLPGGIYQPSLVSSRDGGRSWGAPVVVASVPSVGQSRPYLAALDPFGIGHYQGLAIGSDGLAHLAWPDLRPGGDPEIVTTWVRAVSLP